MSVAAAAHRNGKTIVRNNDVRALALCSGGRNELRSTPTRDATGCTLSENVEQKCVCVCALDDDGCCTSARRLPFHDARTLTMCVRRDAPFRGGHAHDDLMWRIRLENMCCVALELTEWAGESKFGDTLTIPTSSTVTRSVRSVQRRN